MATRKKTSPARSNAPSKTVTFFEDATAGPRQSLESGSQSVDGFSWLHVWVAAASRENLAMDRVMIQVLFSLPGRLETGSLADFTVSSTPRVEPLAVESGPPAGGSGNLAVRVPVIGPAVRVVVVNLGEHTYGFSVFGFLTR